MPDMSREDAETIDKFIRIALDNETHYRHHIYRGQAVEGHLLPGVARAKPKDNSEQKERTALKGFELAAASLLPGKHELLDLMIIGQHYGLKTRLLDWTANPLIALYFACSDSQPGDAYVYALDADPLIAQNAYDPGFDPFEVNHTKVIQPRMNNPRVVAQGGWFTLHRYSRTAGAFIPLERQVQGPRSLAGYLLQIRIPAGRRGEMLDAVGRLGARASTVFPDLSGLCTDLNLEHGLSARPTYTVPRRAGRDH
jgi:hypothetical protein